MDNAATIYSAMQTGKPYKTYRKAILGKVYVQILDPFDTGKMTGILLTGNPKNPADYETASVNLWSEKEDAFFRRSNRRHLEVGNLIESARNENIVPPKFENELSDNELDDMLGHPFLKLQKEVYGIDSLPVVFRILERAREIDKPEKTVSMLESRVSELQLSEYENANPDGD